METSKLLAGVVEELRAANCQIRLRRRIRGGCTNLLYEGHFNGKNAVIKIFLGDGRTAVEREMEFRRLLRTVNLFSPEVYYVGDRVNFLIMEHIIGHCPLDRESMLQRASDCAMIHGRFSEVTGECHPIHISERTRGERESLFLRATERLKHRGVISDQICERLQARRFVAGDAAPCVVFYDYVPYNSMQKAGDRALYYFDFERACISQPFLDPACLVLFDHSDLDLIAETYCAQLRRSGRTYQHYGKSYVRMGIVLAGVERTVEILDFFVSGHTTATSHIQKYVLGKYRKNLEFLMAVAVA